MYKAVQAASHFRVPLGLVHFNAQRTDFTVYSTQADTRHTHTNYPHTRTRTTHTRTHTIDTLQCLERVPLGWPDTVGNGSLVSWLHRRGPVFSVADV